MKLQSSKNLGGIGAILLLIAAILFFISPSFALIVGLIGVIFVLVGLHGLADYYRERGIFHQGLYGVIVAIVGVVIAFAVAFLVVLSSLIPLLKLMFPDWNGQDWAALQGMTPDTSVFTSGDFDLNTLVPFAIGVISVLAILWIFTIIATFFIRRSLKMVSAKSTVGLFGTAGLLLLIGAVLIILFGFGFILMWIAALLLAIAFFQLKPGEPETVPPPPTFV